MYKVGYIFANTTFYQDYWRIIDKSKQYYLIEATYFNGRPNPEVRDCSKEQTCPFKQCNYKLNQFCLRKRAFNHKRKYIVSPIKFQILQMQGKVIYANWDKRNKNGEPIITKQRQL